MNEETNELYEERCATLDRRLHVNGLELSTASKEDLIAQLAPGELESMTPEDVRAYLLALIILDHVKMFDNNHFIQEQANPTAFKCRLYVEAIAAAKLEMKKRAMEQEKQKPDDKTQTPESEELEQTVRQSRLQPLPSGSSAPAPGPSNSVQE
ncbi:hypothetical protein AAVH_14550 [Aphelenchoides avenae]|nr:hypothetical protein AAVH_14550 [Aphelenchus avenae]